MAFCSSRRTRASRSLVDLPVTCNFVLVGLGVFILIAMSVVLGVFEEFTAFTDYTQQWIEFNFFIYYWDKLTITRVYLSFIFIYGAAIIAVPIMQINGIRKKNLNFLHLAPWLMVFLAVITVLGAICWLIVTAVNYNEGFLATGGFIFERMRFKGNVWKDLIYREQSFRMVTENRVPRKSPILNIWVHQRERDFSCCGWDSYLDYAKGNFSNLPESCCQRKYRVYGCGDDYLNTDIRSSINTRGCRDVMYSWYRSGFAENIIMSIIGIAIGAFEFYLYSLNRREYFKVLDEMDDMRKPMMNTTMSMSTINSKGSGGIGGVPGVGIGPVSGHLINLGPQAQKYPSARMMSQHQQPSIGGGGSSAGLLPQLSNDLNNQYNNPLQNIQNSSGRFGYNRPKGGFNNTPSDKVFITESDQN